MKKAIKIVLYILSSLIITLFANSVILSKIWSGGFQVSELLGKNSGELAERIRQIVEETGCEKVNIIAHSKGGLDSRYAISECGMGKYVASLTTINTPHRGCEFADYLLSKIPADGATSRLKMCSWYRI